MSDIELVFNQAQDGLYGSSPKDRTPFDLCFAINSVKEPFIKFCKAHEKRLRLCVPFHRVNLAHPREEDPTFVTIPGFVTEWSVMESKGRREKPAEIGCQGGKAVPRTPQEPISVAACRIAHGRLLPAIGCWVDKLEEKIYILNKNIIHLVDDFFWFMGFKTTVDAERVNICIICIFCIIPNLLCPFRSVQSSVLQIMCGKTLVRQWPKLWIALAMNFALCSVLDGLRTSTKPMYICRSAQTR
jgi:hypothetical protein